MRRHYFWPVMLIIAGVVFLLDQFAWFPGSAWNWILAIGLIWAGVILLWPRRRPAVTRVEESVTLEGAQRAQVTLQHGAGRLVVHGGAAPDQLLAGSFGGGVEKNVQRDGNQAQVVLQLPNQDWEGWLWPAGALDWEIRLNPTVPLALVCKTGATENRLDLETLRVTDVTIKTGASSTELTVPAQAGHTCVNIEAGAASVKIRVPAGVAARVAGLMGLGTINVNAERFPRLGNAYQSADYDTAANRVDIHIQGGVGAVEVN